MYFLLKTPFFGEQISTRISSFVFFSLWIFVFIWSSHCCFGLFIITSKRLVLLSGTQHGEFVSKVISVHTQSRSPWGRSENKTFWLNILYTKRLKRLKKGHLWVLNGTSLWGGKGRGYRGSWLVFGKSRYRRFILCKCLEICLKNKIETNLRHGIAKAYVWFLQKYYNRVCILQVRILRKLSFKREIIWNYYWLFQRREISFLLITFRSLQRLFLLDNWRLKNTP